MYDKIGNLIVATMLVCTEIFNPVYAYVCRYVFMGKCWLFITYINAL